MELMQCILAGAAGGSALAILYFVGLWWTLRHLARTPHPEGWLIGSYYLRTAVTAMGMLGLALLDWRALIVGSVAFLLTRTAVQRAVCGAKPSITCKGG